MRCAGLLILMAIAIGAQLAAARSEEAAAHSVLVRQAVQPADAVVGQRVTVVVDVLFPDEMPAPPKVSLPEIPGTQVFRFESQGTTVRERVSGIPYVGQRFEFALFARRGGSFTLLPADVVLLDRRREAVGTAHGQEATLAVRVPPGVDASRPVVATARLTLDQHWDPAPTNGFKVGGALKRTVIREAEDVPALAMQGLTDAAPDGVRAYADAPVTEDRSNRGTLTGRRTDRITYVFEKAGEFALPALGQPWWDLAGQSLRLAEAPGVRVRVQPGPAGELASRPASERTNWLSWYAYAAGMALFALVLWAARHAGVRAAKAFAAGVERQEQSEPAEFRHLRHACRGTQAGETYAALCRWRARFEEKVGVSQARETAVAAAAGPLEAHLFGGGAAGTWVRPDARRLIERLHGVRKEARERASHSRRATAPLPPLNPVSQPLGAARPRGPWSGRRSV